MQIEVNGTAREVGDGSTVADLLDSLDLDGRMVVVELNRQIVRRPQIEETHLEPGDRVELVHFVGGG